MMHKSARNAPSAAQVAVAETLPKRTAAADKWPFPSQKAQEAVVAASQDVSESRLVLGYSEEEQRAYRAGYAKGYSDARHGLPYNNVK